MEPRVLTDKNQYPTEEIIFSHIGKVKTLWISVFDFIKTDHPDMSTEWRYYNDGGSWLMKVTRKTKTICWISVIKNAFRMTFYLSTKAEQAVMKSSIPDDFKKQYKEGMKTKKINGLTIVFKNKKDFETAKELIAVKLSVK